MDNTFWFLLATSMLLSALFILYRTATTRSRSSSSSTATNSLPSGSLGWPLLGETLEFISCAYSDSPESFMDKRRHWYGKVFKSHLFGSPTIVSTDAEVSKFILQSDGNVFVPSYPKSLTELMGKSSILLINGSLQRRVHGLIGAFFKSPQLKAQITRDMHKYVYESMGNWREDQPIYIQDQAKNISFQVLLKALISVGPGDDMDFLKKQFQEFIEGLMSLPINVPGSRLHRSLQEENLKLKKLKDQLGEPLCWRDYFSLPFTQNVITETLRMGNIIVGVMRKAMKDVQVKGYLIPKGWCVLTYFRSIHLDEDFYDWPHQFNPWRWQDKEMSNCSFSPFGGGQRLCPGLDLARLETSIFLHHFVTQFRWVAEADSIVNFPTVRMKKRMPVWIKRRREAAFSQEEIKTFQGTSMQ
ncbi:3-epi-6-deoxocathasterone 23-monooxygenase CYP90D1-like isoform X2 [Actinidia eriantha]|uniref:3-epi-6-deoxocathasterone 23-monooxygenase CYP90D1-like isoform X2 n=1 Tax=Actinidia eriantha TaxID=165200 RepID=UPI00258762B7|nr:3-epi-6-deoxocathasterone 23-monooxygenase CYP90D1-like isoform X2 [Actinidia eriantha]